MHFLKRNQIKAFYKIDIEILKKNKNEKKIKCFWIIINTYNNNCVPNYAGIDLQNRNNYNNIITLAHLILFFMFHM